MSENTKHRDQTKAIYAAIGRFVVDFEQVVFRMRSHIAMLATQGGPASNQHLVAATVAEQTAGPIGSILRGIMKSSVNDFVQNEADQVAIGKIIDEPFARWQTMCQTRNDVVHGTWFVGWGNAETVDWSEADRLRPKLTKSGLDLRSETFTAERIEQLADECNAIQQIINGLAVCVRAKGRVSILANYCIGPDNRTSRIS